MASNLDDSLGEIYGETTGERRGPVLPLTPVQIDLERRARHAYSDIMEIMGRVTENARRFELPLSIFYKERSSDRYLSVQVRNTRHKTLYPLSQTTADYLPLFQAVAFSHILGSLLQQSNYPCKVTKEVVKE